MPDAHKNFAFSLIATAPSPATSGTSLVVASGEGALFPAVPFNATVWPAGAQPSTSNAEIVRVTNIATDTLTITRAQEGTAARTVIVGDQIAATITAKTLEDVEAFYGGAIGSVLTLTSNFTTTATTNTDTALSFAVAANEVWVIQAQMTTTSGAAGGKLQVSAPTGAAVEGWTECGPAGGAAGENRQRINAINTLSSAHINAAACSTTVRATITNGANAGTIAIGVASITGGQTTTVFTGSSLLKFKK